MSNTQAPREIMMKLIEGIGQQNWDALVDLYIEDVIIEWPLALPTPVVIRGRKELQTTLQNAWKTLEFRISHMRVYETDDPEVMIAEYDYNGRILTTGKAFRSANVLVSTIRNGCVVSARGYHNHAVLAAASETLEQMIPLIDLTPPKF